MFDVDLPGGESYRESALYRAGANAAVADLPWARIGLSVCYDVRFPHLYRALAQAGAAVIAIPAAFTKTTGEAHWHVLVRARAIETGSYVVAAAQGGHHEDGRDTYGHSLIVDPWGKVLAEAGTEPGIIVGRDRPGSQRRRAAAHPRARARPRVRPPAGGHLGPAEIGRVMIRYALRCDRDHAVRRMVRVRRGLRPRGEGRRQHLPGVRLGQGREGDHGASRSRAPRRGPPDRRPTR